MTSTPLEHLVRDLSPQVLGILVRRYGDFAACEDAVQEALLAATEQWADDLPANPLAWLVTVASRRRIEHFRRDAARMRREEIVVAREPPLPAQVSAYDDTLALLRLCCHPSLTAESQVALTLRAVGGLTTAEIARAFLVPETTMGQRIGRAKQTIKRAGAAFVPSESEPAPRTDAVLHVLYLIFNEGYLPTAGELLHRVDLTAEAIRLARQLSASLPHDGEVTGLLALMLLTDARRPARTSVDGSLVPLADQDRDRWDSAMIAEGVALLAETLASGPVGPFQLQAAIAAVHAEARHADETDWPQILALYDLLQVCAPGPIVTLNRLVALARVDGPRVALAALDEASVDRALSGHHRLAAVRAHLLELIGDRDAAQEAYREAARRTTNEAERRYLEGRADLF